MIEKPIKLEDELNNQIGGYHKSKEIISIITFQLKNEGQALFTNLEEYIKDNLDMYPKNFIAKIFYTIIKYYEKHYENKYMNEKEKNKNLINKNEEQNKNIIKNKNIINMKVKENKELMQEKDFLLSMNPIMFFIYKKRSKQINIQNPGCKYCKWYQGLTCDAPNNRKIIKTAIKDKIEFIQKPKKKNELRDCPDFLYKNKIKRLLQKTGNAS